MFFCTKWEGIMAKLKRTICILLAAILISSFSVQVSNITAQAASSNEAQVYTFLRNSCGFTKAGACGVMSNMYSESRFIPTATNKYSGAYGLCQWYKPRKTALINWCRSHGYNYKTLKGQLNFFKYEINTSYFRKAKNAVKTASNSASGAYWAGYNFCRYYECPGNIKYYGNYRGNIAKNTFWSRYKNR